MDSEGTPCFTDGCQDVAKSLRSPAERLSLTDSATRPSDPTALGTVRLKTCDIIFARFKSYKETVMRH
jgi:hypothetical protein